MAWYCKDIYEWVILFNDGTVSERKGTKKMLLSDLELDYADIEIRQEGYEKYHSLDFWRSILEL